MSAKMQLKRLAIVAGLSIMSLTSSFNAAVATTEPPLAPDSVSTQFKDSVVSLNQQVQQVFIDINTKAAERSMLPGYHVETDLEIQQAADKLKALLAKGANPDHIVDKGLTLFSATGLNAFHAGIVLAAEIKRPDVVKAFLDAGASATAKAPDNWSAMDYALSSLMGAQQETEPKIDAAIAIIKMLNAKGAQLSDAAEIIKISKGALKTYADLALNTVGLKALYHAGLVSVDEYNAVVVGKPGLSDVIRNMKTITAETLKTYGATRMDYHDAPPGGPEPYEIAKNDTLWSIADRFQGPMGAATHQEALRLLIARNNIALDAKGNPKRQLAIGETILIPVPVHVQIGYLTPKEGTTLREIAKELKPGYYNQSLSVEGVAAELAKINGLDLKRIDDKTLLKKDQQLQVAFLNDSHNQLPQMTPPAHYKGDREVDLMVIEPQDDHGKNTYRVATGTAYSVNPRVDLGNFHSWSEMLLDFPNQKMSDMLRMLLNAVGSPVQDRVIFSHSMAFKFDEPKADQIRNNKAFGSVQYEQIRLFLDQLDQARPIIFNAAGNFWPKEGRYIQSYQATHSPRAVMIGAVGRYSTDIVGGEDRVMSHYSTHSADICSPLPKFLGDQMEGTSFSTPLTAALYRQMSEWYGDRLSFEEIIAAALMTADRDVLDYVKHQNLGKNPLVQPDKFDAQGAEFRTNGGGLPNHERCGAGALNPQRWQQALDVMLVLKQDLAKDAGHTVNVQAGTPRILPAKAGGTAEYVYSIRVPADMTLGKLTFLLPQDAGRHSEIVVRTPAGFEKHMPKSLTDVASTFAFAYEDLRAGQAIEIRTTEPLGPTAGIMLRGHAPGNAIASLRNYLRATGVMPAPIQTMEGNKIVGPLKPVTVLQDKPTPAKPVSTSASPPTPDMPTPDMPTPPLDMAPMPVPPQQRIPGGPL